MDDKQLKAIARVVHEANRAWCAAHGDASQPPWEAAEDWMREATEAGIRFRLENPSAPSDAQHKQWSEEKRAAGWSYGPAKNAAAKTHPMLIPYKDLPEFEKKKDALFSAVVRALADESGGAEE